MGNGVVCLHDTLGEPGSIELVARYCPAPREAGIKLYLMLIRQELLAHDFAAIEDGQEV